MPRDEQADFPIIYANAITAQAGLTPELGSRPATAFSGHPAPHPAPCVDVDAPLQMLVTTLGYDDYRGVTAVGRIHAGQDAVGSPGTHHA